MENLKTIALPKLEEHLDDHKYKSNFDSLIRRYMMKVIEPTVREFIYFLETTNSNDIRIAELGCYDEYSTEIIMKEFPFPYEINLTVIEESKALAKKVKDKNLDNVRVVNSLYRDYKPKKKFDFLVMIQTIERLEDAAAELKHIRTWLAEDNSYIFIACPNADSLSSKIAVEMGIDLQSAYTVDTLKEVCNQAGIKVIESGGIFLKPFSNAQFDKAIESGIVSRQYLDACFALGKRYPDLAASCYIIGKKS